MKHRLDRRTSAYVDFIRGVAGVAIVQREPVKEREHILKEWELLTLVADAKARIAIYGSKSVVASLAGFLRSGSVLDTPERAKDYTAVCQKMRGDTRPKAETARDEDVHFLLFDFEMKQHP